MKGPWTPSLLLFQRSGLRWPIGWPSHAWVEVAGPWRLEGKLGMLALKMVAAAAGRRMVKVGVGSGSRRGLIGT